MHPTGKFCACSNTQYATGTGEAGLTVSAGRRPLIFSCVIYHHRYFCLAMCPLLKLMVARTFVAGRAVAVAIMLHPSAHWQILKQDVGMRCLSAELLSIRKRQS